MEDQEPKHRPIGLNEAIKQHAKKSADWRYHGKSKETYDLADKINALLFDSEIPQIVLSFDDEGRRKKAGHYYPDGDGMSLYNHIELRPDLTKMELVVALIHNLLHAQSEVYGDGKSWYHNKKWRDVMAGFGLMCDKSGDLTTIEVETFAMILNKLELPDLVKELGTYAPVEAVVSQIEVEAVPEVALVGALKQHQAKLEQNDQINPFSGASKKSTVLGKILSGEPDFEDSGTSIFMPEGASPIPTSFPPISVSEPGFSPAPANIESVQVEKPKKKSTSKMKKWSCECTNVRCAVQLDATCNKCGGPFTAQE